jgi:hypothetical protein
MAMTNLNSIQYASTSFYYSTRQVTTQGVSYLSNWPGITIAPASTDTLISLPAKYNLRPDLLSYDLYGTSQLWWVFIVRNPDVLQDPIYDFITGAILFVPSQASLGAFV